MVTTLANLFASSDNKQAQKKEARRWMRFPIKTDVEVLWQEDGQQKSTIGRGIEMSDTGMSIRTPQPMPFGSLVYITVTKLRLTGQAMVRHCAKKGLAYSVGLEFRGRLMSVNWLGR